MTDQRKSYLYAGFSIFMWSTVASAFKLALELLDVIQILFYATLTSTAALLFVIIGQGKVRIFLGQTKNDLLSSALLGLFNPLIYYLIVFKAYDLLPAQEAQPLNWIWPIVLSILSAIVLKQKLSLRMMAAILISFSGVVIISVKGNFSSYQFSDPLGTFLALVSSIFWAVYWVLNLKDRREPVIKLALNFIFAFIYICVVAGLFSGFYLPSYYELGLTIYIGLFEMGLTFVMWLKALSLSKTSAKIASFAFLAPFVSLIFIHFIVGEEILASSIMGLILIVAGIILQTTQTCTRGS